MSSLYVLSQTVGWIYFFAWGISFYGQILENFKLKNVKGMSFEFVALNLTGFLYLSVYSSVGFFYPGNLNGTYEVQDLCFAYNAVLATLVTISQAFIYPREQGQRVEPWCVGLLIALWSFTIVYLIIQLAGWVHPDTSSNVWACMGYEKLLISLVKYIPQVIRNYERQSTVGWSICNIICDFTGGSLSFLQIVIDNLDKGQTSIFDGGLNIVKFGLSLISMFFDVIFLVQHYCLYSQNNKQLLLNSKDEMSIQQYNKVKPTQ